MLNNKILLVIDNLGSGGAQNQLTLIAIELKKRGADVTFFTYYPQSFFKKRLIDNKIDIIYEEKKGRLGLNVINTLRRIINTGNYNTIISYLDTPSFYVAVARRLSSSENRFLMSYRSKTDFSIKKGLKLKFMEWVNQQADYIICNSHHERKTWSNRYPQLKPKISTIYNIVDTNHFNRRTIRGMNTNGRIRLLSIGTISKYKNVDFVIEAIKHLRDQNVDFKFTWLGRKFFKNENSMDYFKYVDSKISEYNLQEYWEWKDPNNNIDVLTYYHSTDIFVLASIVEGLPNVLCEALSCGLPCIVSKTLDHPRLMDKNKNGLTFDLNSPIALTKAILEMLSQKNLFHSKYEINARKFALNAFSDNKILNQYIKVIEG